VKPLAALGVACWGFAAVASEPEGATEVLRVTVAPQLVDCAGVGPMKCLVVDGLNFYQAIEGFEHEAGVTYKLEIQKSQRFAPENAPADASLFEYRLLKVLSRTPS
jgi:hypothetical protein